MSQALEVSNQPTDSTVEKQKCANQSQMQASGTDLDKRTDCNDQGTDNSVSSIGTLQTEHNVGKASSGNHKASRENLAEFDPSKEQSVFIGLKIDSSEQILKKETVHNGSGDPENEKCEQVETSKLGIGSICATQTNDTGLGKAQTDIDYEENPVTAAAQTENHKLSKNTLRSISWAVSLFNSWRDQRVSVGELIPPLEECDINKHLSRYVFLQFITFVYSNGSMSVF